jgi:predicted SAM-dependent methyltransferase
VSKRLNLGCGGKLLPGFVNVDLANNWSDVAPDVIADVTGKLPFDTDSADEVHAYHVLEHLRRWQADECLVEWVRVLKPGGLLVLEMPCLDKVLDLFGYFIKRGKPIDHRLTMWALYGDPNYQNDAMCHRWAYSVSELVGMLEQIGMKDITEQEPKTHIKIRDMRLVATKP